MAGNSVCLNMSPTGEAWGRRLARLLGEVFEDPLVRGFAELAGVQVLPEYLSGVGSYCAMLGLLMVMPASTCGGRGTMSM